MKVKYLKDTHDSKVGDEKEIPDYAANVLILLGVAEKIRPETTAAKKKETAQEKVD